MKKSTDAEENSQPTERSGAKTVHYRNSKEVRPRKPATGAIILSVPVGIQQIEDPRSLLPSWQKQAGASNGGSGTGAASRDGVTAAVSAHIPSTTLLPKGELAFSVSLPKAGNDKVNLAAESSTNAVAAADKASHDQGKRHSDTADSNDSPAPKTAILESTPKSQTTDATVPAAITPVAVITGAPSSPFTPYSDTNLGKSAPTPAASEIDLPPTPVSRPPQSIDLKVAGVDNNQVDVRISQRAGDVQVTVRTPDNDLAESLRQHLPELSDRLAQNGVSGEIWQPASTAASADTAGNQESWNSDQSSSQQQQQQQRNPDGQPNQAPEDSRASNWRNNFNKAEKEDR